MFGVLKQLFLGQKRESKSLAKSRLHFVLVQDRTGLTSDEMTDFKREMMEVVERYFVVDKRGFDVSYKREGDSTTLLINSPVIVKREIAGNYTNVANGEGLGTSGQNLSRRKRKKLREQEQQQQRPL